MKSPFIKTLVMAVIAIIASGVAASFYPWPVPIVESEIVGKPLFESYETTAVRSIRITEFNDDRNELDRMVLRRSGEKWIIPDRKKFIASNAMQISAAASSLNEVLVLDEKTDEQQAYLEYGVIDPDEYLTNPNRSALGTKIILEDRNGKPLASLIVGKMLKDDPSRKKRFVRIPGQPSVYVIDFNPLALSTDFRSWVDPNLLQLGNQIPVDNILIENYQINPEVGTDSRQLNYRAELAVGQEGLKLVSVESGGSDGKWTKVGSSQKMTQQVQVVLNQIINIQFSDVRKKNVELAKLLREPRKDADDKLLDVLKPLGFFKSGFEHSTHQFESSGGDVTVATKDGVVVTLYIGTIADKTNSDDFKLRYNVMICAGVDESILPEPEKSAANDNPEVAEQEEKAYLREVEQRNTFIKSAYLRAAEFNQRHAEWIYIVSETVIENIRPDLDLSSSNPLSPTSKIGDALKIDPTETDK